MATLDNLSRNGCLADYRINRYQAICMEIVFT